jgi:hypothetical protein
MRLSVSTGSHGLSNPTVALCPLLSAFRIVRHRRIPFGTIADEGLTGKAGLLRTADARVAV